MRWEDRKEQKRKDRIMHITLWVIAVATVAGCMAIAWTVRHFANVPRFETGDIP